MSRSSTQARQHHLVLSAVRGVICCSLCNQQAMAITSLMVLQETQNPPAQAAILKVQAAELAAHAEISATATITAAPKLGIAEADQQPAGRQGMRRRVAAKLRHYGRAVAAVRPAQKGPTGAVSQAGYDAQVALSRIHA